MQCFSVKNEFSNVTGSKSPLPQCNKWGQSREKWYLKLKDLWIIKWSLKNIFTGYRILGWQILLLIVSVKTLKCQCTASGLYCITCIASRYLQASLYLSSIWMSFSLVALIILFLLLSSVIAIYLSTIFFMSSALNSLNFFNL